MIVSHDLISFPFICSIAEHFSLLSSDHDAITSSSKSNWLSVIVTFTHQKIFTSSLFKVISGALFTTFSLMVKVEVFHSLSVMVTSRSHDFFSISHGLTSSDHIFIETLQFCV